MATAKDTTTKTAPSAQTMMWEGEEVTVLNGSALVDKATLVDVPFKITGIKITETKPDQETGEVVEYMVVEVYKSRTEKVFFNDSSTGVKVELEGVLRNLYPDFNGEHEKWYDLPGYFCPQGLRASHYEKTVRGKKVPATTYYLTYSGNERP